MLCTFGFLYSVKAFPELYVTLQNNNLRQMAIIIDRFCNLNSLHLLLPGINTPFLQPLVYDFLTLCCFLMRLCEFE